MLAVFDCFSGIAGDMCLGALVSAIGDADWLTLMVERMGIDGCRAVASDVRRGPLAAVKVEVVRPPHDRCHRRLSDLRQLVSRCGLPPRAAARADAVLVSLVQAEAVVHGDEPEAIHLHEAGGLDAIVDIAGTCLGLELLGVDEIFAGPLPLGGGIVRCEHGLLPVPAPAVVQLLRGMTVVPGSASDGEAVTPTGAAILVGLAASQAVPPTLSVQRVGYGAGTRSAGVAGLPNVLRLLICDRARSGATPTESVVVVDATIDDMTPELLAAGVESLLRAGALEVLRKPVVTAKGRCAWEVTVIAPPGRREEVLAALFTSTSTIGARERLSERVTLERDLVVVSTPYGPVQVKVARFRGEIVNAKPEHADCVHLAEQAGTDVKRVAAAANAAAASLYMSNRDVPRGTSAANSSGTSN